MKSNEEVQKAVQRALRWQPKLNAADIGVTVHDGVVTLSGMVDSYAKKEEAEKAVKKVTGVRAVVENIAVQLAQPGAITDQDIAASIVQSFKWHWDIPEHQIRIQVENGLVTLEGEVNWNYEREAARKVASQLIGVRGVKNNITIKVHHLTDKIDVRDIESALWRNPDIDDEQVDVTVDGHTVRLNGTVRSWYQKEEAGRMAWSAPGVEHVDNQLLVDNTAD